MVEVVGDYQFKKEDLLGHGAFAIVFRGSSCAVSDQDSFSFVVVSHI